MARVLVTGVTGQIGTYLAELLLSEGHEVMGIGGPDDVRLPEGVIAAAGSFERVDQLLSDNGALDAVVHLAGRSSVAASWEDPVGTFDTNGRLTVALAFAAAKRQGLRFVHASSAEIFGNTAAPVQDESTPLAPISPYAVAKAAAHLGVKITRDGLGAPASNLIFYLGESPRRPTQFVFRKITRGVAAIANGKQRELVLGRTSVVRDFCHARDLAHAARLLALGATPGDYVCASGEGHTILEVAITACKIAGVDPKVVRSDPALFRGNDIHSLVGDSRHLRALGWSPSVGFEALVREVVEHDLEAHRAGLAHEGGTPGAQQTKAAT
jgi:GDPmannose 4,6-dehydratase